MAFFTNIPKSSDAEKVPLLTQASEDDDSSGYDSPVYTKEDSKKSKAMSKTENYHFDDSDSDFSSDEEFRSDDSFSDSDDDLDDIVHEKEEGDNDSMKVISMRALTDNMKYLLSLPGLCDVTFLVGPQRVPVHGLKAILGSRSRTFYSMFLRQAKEMNSQQKKKKGKENKTELNNKTTISIDRYDVDVFRSFILFLHCGSVTIDASIVTGLLCCAAEFDVPDLNKACWEFINRSTAASSDCMMKETIRYGDHTTAKQLRIILVTRREQINERNIRNSENKLSTNKETEV